MTVELACPTCGTVSHFEDLNRDADAFCRVCDYPLFWVRSAQLGAAAAETGNGLRRLPGTAGKVALATIECPACTEPNPVTANICIRCGADLRPAPPAPVIELPPLPPPPPAPIPEPPPARVIWPWILLGVLGVIAVVILIVLLV